MKIAIIGGGISGLTCATLLNDQHDITLYEANDYLGGHTHTVDVEVRNKTYAIDTGFIVFNNRTYPNFINLLTKLDVAWQATEMSFSVCDETTGLEYNGHNLNTLFAQRRNLFNPRFYKMLSEIARFNRQCKALAVASKLDEKLSLGQFLAQHRYSAYFQQNYVLPMVAAIWSSSLDDAQDFPLAFFVRFFMNHGLLNIRNRPTWYVVKGGSRQYVRAIEKRLGESVRLSSPVQSISRKENQVEIHSNGQTEDYDEVIIASHSNQALTMLSDPNKDERSVLGALAYQPNEVVLHTDKRLLPKSQRAWASWNYRLRKVSDHSARPAQVSYIMNILQGIHSDTSFIVSLNQTEYIDPTQILGRYNYDHPVYTNETEAARRQRDKIDGHNRTHYCGAYWYNGFHEDGVRSALDVVQRFGANL
ncbi:MAG: FAD-dependent oxidoreductase [Kangiellaceae bacterium]|nr:FAD-dependent oxidoreductase [Kangiellaceae bacterium]|tara:strand:+ start:1666 stop:2922 length:1257 start_codon:yes stop_codon:yes gene_type:complete